MQRDHAWIATLVVGLGATAVAPLLPALPAVILYDLIAVAAAVAMVVGIAWHRPARMRGWILLTVGVGLWATGDLVFTFLGGGTGVPPFPSAADPMYLVGTAALIAGTLDLARRPDQDGTRGVIIDTSIVSLSAGIVVWLLVLAPLVSDPTLGPLERGVSIGYPLLDLGLLSATILLILGRGRGRNLPLWLLATAAGALLVSDLLYSFSSVQETYAVGDLVEYGWLVAYVLFAAAALHPAISQVGAPEGDRRPGAERARMLLLGTATVVTPLCFVLVIATVDDPDQLVRDVASVALLSAITIGLLVWRVANATRTLARALRTADASARRDRLVASVSTALARATDRAEVSVAVGRLAELFPADPVSVTLRRAGELEASPSVRVPLRERSEAHLGNDAIVVAGVAELTPETRTAIETIAGEAALALDRWRLTRELRSSEERFRSLVQHAPDAITVQDETGVITYASPAMGRILGLPAASLVGTRFGDLVHPDDPKADPREGAGDGHLATLERRLRRVDGSYRWVESRLTDRRADPSVGGIVANHRDVTERRELEAQLLHQAEHDALTGLANRRRFATVLDRALEAARAPFVLYLDLDRFKEVNDRFGHPAGDELLQRAAGRIVRCLRSEDLCARLGGDEFAVLLEDADEERATAVADRLLRTLAEPFALSAGEVTLTASIGITSMEGPDGGAAPALGRADVAMYEAKRAGRGRAVFYEDHHLARTMRALDLEAALRLAVARGDLEVHHQPILDVATGTCTGAEALLRWQHPERGPVGPDEFIPIAERTGLIVPLGLFVLEEACTRAAGWSRPDRPFRMNVNVSVQQLLEPSFPSEVARVLDTTGLPAAALTLEITESTLLDRSAATTVTLAALRRLGVRLAIDDFGTGYATLRTLEDVPADVLKIDRSFTRNLTGGVEDDAIVRAVLQLARSFDLDAVAEGVETAAQFEALRELGCTRAQGHRFAAAMPADEFVPWVRYTDEAGALLERPVVAELG